MGQPALHKQTITPTPLRFTSSFCNLSGTISMVLKNRRAIIILNESV